MKVKPTILCKCPGETSTMYTHKIIHGHSGTTLGVITECLNCSYIWLNAFCDELPEPKWLKRARAKKPFALFREIKFITTDQMLKDTGLDFGEGRDIEEEDNQQAKEKEHSPKQTKRRDKRDKREGRGKRHEDEEGGYSPDTQG